MRSARGIDARDAAALTGAVTALANALARGLTPAETTLLAGILVQLSDTLNTIVAQESLLAERDNNEG